MPTKKQKKAESKVARCPRCGSELYSISDMDLAGHFVRCPKCGFGDEMVDQKSSGQVSDIEIERAARGM